MPSRDEENTRILIQIAGDIGETREGIVNLKENVGTLSEDFRDVKDQLTQTVKQHECTQRHVVVAQSLDAMKKDLIDEIKKVPTGTNHPAITPEMLRAASAPTVQEVEKALEERKEEKADKKRKAVTFWLATISTGIALFSGCALGIYKMVTFMNKVETTVAGNTKEVRSEIQKNHNKIVYVTVPVMMRPDSGVIRIDNPDRKIRKVIPKKPR